MAQLEQKSTLKVEHIRMEFPGVLALDDISFEIESGKVTALMGENGAGKSTLLKILYGDYHPTKGHVYLDGEKKEFHTPHEAIEDGISIIYQERQIVEYLDVAENVFMGKLPTKNGLIDYKTLREETQRLIDEFELPIKPTDKVKDLSIAHQQMVEIMKAYNRDLKMIAFDEPTASLSDKEIRSLFQIIEKLKKRGVIIFYVSHRMKEIFEISDEIIVFKDGCFVGQVQTKDTNEQALVKMMVGRDLGDVFDSIEHPTDIGQAVLEVKNLTNDYISDVSFDLRKGEILGLAGLVGAGRSETVRAIYGADKVDGGQIILEGSEVKFSNPREAIEMGIGLCPEDRKTQGLVLSRTVKENFSMSIIKQFVRSIFIHHAKEKEACNKAVDQLAIKTPGIDQTVINLSGGNQQKIIFARLLASKPKILILDEPTKGIDVGAKAEIYKLICDVAREGISVIVISSELQELIGLCNRIIVMGQGTIKGEVSKEEATEEKILTYAMEGM